VTDGRKCIVGKSKVIKREKIKVKDTVLHTFLVERILSNWESLRKSKNANSRSG
jgi:hypothetical protein